MDADLNQVDGVMSSWDGLKQIGFVESFVIAAAYVPYLVLLQ